VPPVMLWTLASGGTEGGKRAKMTTIGMETIRLMGSQVEALLLDYMTEIDKAYLVMGGRSVVRGDDNQGLSLIRRGQSRNRHELCNRQDQG